VLRRYADRAALQRAVGRGQLDAGLVLPPDYDARVAARAAAALGYLARPDSVAQQPGRRSSRSPPSRAVRSSPPS
jgi:hypothetical protein